jgi:hypothetical protein
VYNISNQERVDDCCNQKRKYVVFIQNDEEWRKGKGREVQIMWARVQCGTRLSLVMVL